MKLPLCSLKKIRDAFLGSTTHSPSLTQRNGVGLKIRTCVPNFLTGEVTTSKKNGNKNVSSFCTFLFSHPSVFILDSGSTSHMVSNRNLFTLLDKTERGLINTSCGPNTLAIEGKGSISMLFMNKPIVLHDFLLVLKITVNLLSLHCLLLNQCKVKFDINNFQVIKKEELFLSGHYHNKLPVVKL